MSMSSERKGTLAMLASCTMFAVIFLYVHWMQPLTGTEVFAWRMPGMWVGLLVLMFATRSWQSAFKCWRYLRSHPKALAAFLITSPIFALQLWLFLWAPANGHALDASLGYFLLPVCLVVVGCVFYRERLSAWQTLAVALAVAGIVHELWVYRSFSWVTLTVCFGYSTFFGLRRRLRVPTLVALFLDMTLIAPFAVAYLALSAPHVGEVLASPRLWGLVVLLGAMSCVALLLSFAAARMMPLSLYGIMGNLEPMLMFVASLLILKEHPSAQSWITYTMIWGSLCCLMAEGTLKWFRRGAKTPFRQPETVPPPQEHSLQSAQNSL